MSRYDILIVGAGHGGAQVALMLRQQKFAGSIALLETSPSHLTSVRLSKDYLSGEKIFERILIRPASFWGERNIDLLLDRRVIAVDPIVHAVTLADASSLGYGQLVWATGGSSRRLACPGHDLVGVHGVRTRADVDRMIAEMPGVTNVVVIGGGYIGLEAAAVLAKFGKKVIVLEALDRVLARVAGEPLSRLLYEAEHRAHGVDVRLGARVDGLVGFQGLGEDEPARVTGVHISDGEILPAEMVIVGIGIVPAVEPLLEAGAEGGNGVTVDAQCRTSLPDIFAIGDCAAHANAFARGATIRLESVQNANDQANVVAKTIMGATDPYHAVPWFWSNQYDLKLQTVGLSTGFDQAIVRGDMASRSFSIVYLREGRVIALDCVNAVKDYVQGRALVIGGVSAAPASLADPSVPLKSLVLA